MRVAYPRVELFRSKLKPLRKIRSEQGDLVSLPLMLEGRIDRQHGREPGDVVVPEDTLDLRQVIFVKEGSVAGRLEIDSSDLDVERILLRSHHQIGANGSELTIDFVANVGGYGDHRRGHGYA